MQKFFLSISMLFLVVVLAVVAKDWYSITEPTHYDDDPISVATVQAKVAAMPEWIDTVAPLSAHQHIELKNRVAGQVDRILVKSGSKVSQGEPLIRLLPDFILKSPISGYLGDWQIDVGSFAPEGTTLVSITNKSQLNVLYSVPEIYAGRLQVGQDVIIDVRAFPQQFFSGKVTYVSPVVNEINQSIEVKATLNNVEQTLLPGMFAHVQHILHPNKKAIVVPESAIQHKIYGHEIFVVENNVAKLRQVVLGQKQTGNVQIKQGVKPGEVIVQVLPPTIYDGKAVTTTPFDGEW